MLADDAMLCFVNQTIMGGQRHSVGEILRVKRARGDLRNAHTKENNKAKPGEEDLKSESTGYTGRNP